jgi:hypothetical protein
MYWTFAFETIGKGDTKVETEVIILSRKKANHGKRDRRGEGLRLRWQRGQIVLDGRDGVAPSPPGRPSSAERHIVREAANAVLSDNPHETYTKSVFSDAVSSWLGGSGSMISAETLRRHYLPDLIAEGHPGFDGKRWRFTPGVGPWKGPTPETVKRTAATRARRAATASMH